MTTFAVIGWLLFAGLVIVYAIDDKRAKHIAAENRHLKTRAWTAEQQAAWHESQRRIAERALAMQQHPAGRVLPFRGRSV